MEKKKIVLLSSILCVAAMAVTTAVVSRGLSNMRAFASYQDRNAYVRSLEISASNFQNGSGTFVVEGNQFAYAGATVEGGNVSFAADGYFKSVEDSGATMGSDLTGAGFTTLGAVMAADFAGNVSLNTAAQALNLTSGNTHQFAVNDVRFNLVFTDAGFKVSGFVASYMCQENEVKIDAKADDYIWSSEVRANKLSVNLDADSKTDFYAVKNSVGVYIFGEQHVKTLRNIGDDWWQHDNFEIRIGSQWHTPREDRDQYWMSALKTSNFPHFAVSDIELNDQTGFYDINYEGYFTWAELGYILEDDIVITFGIAYANGWCNSDGWYKVRLDHYRTITTTGIGGLFDYSAVRTGVETMTTPVSGTASGWNSVMVQITMDGTKAWGIKASYRSINDPAGADPNCKGVVAEVFSPGWANGGWTFRKDWWGWGAWNFQHNDNGSGGAGQCGFCDVDEFNGGWVAACCDMNVEEYVSFNPALGRVMVTAVYTSNVEGYVGKKGFIQYSSASFSYRGDMIASFGADGGTLEMNSIQVIQGTKVSTNY